jgi:hypothetical protein
MLSALTIALYLLIPKAGAVSRMHTLSTVTINVRRENREILPAR